MADEIGRANLLHTKEESYTSELVSWACLVFLLHKIGFRMRSKRISAGTLYKCAEGVQLCKSPWRSLGNKAVGSQNSWGVQAPNPDPHPPCPHDPSPCFPHGQSGLPETRHDPNASRRRRSERRKQGNCGRGFIAFSAHPQLQEMGRYI